VVRPWLNAGQNGDGGSGDHPLPADGAGSGPGAKSSRRSIALLVVVALAAGGIGAGITLAVRGTGSSTPAAAAGTSGGSSVQAQTNNAAASAAGSVRAQLAQISPSVVLIKSDVTTQSGNGFFGGGTAQGTSAGTGIIVSTSGEIVTNAHVVAGATDTKVTIPGKGDYSATILGSDTTADLAVLQIQGVSGLTAATFAANSTVHVGDSVIAVGNAEGYGGTPSVSEGIVSALGRSISDDTASLTGLIQTDAAINPGNSGGPLVDTDGRVIGITTAVERGTPSDPAQNIGFAIPSDTVVKNIPLLEKGQTGGSPSGSGGSSASPTTNGGYLGVQVADGPTGPVVAAVETGTPAATAGLQVQDVIQKIDGTSVTDPSDVTSAIQAHKPGDTVTLTIVRNGAPQTVKVTLAKHP
jgi:S1-C subfamily serine protease